MPTSSSATAVEEGGTCCGDSHSPRHSRWLPAAWQGNALMSSPPGLWPPGPDKLSGGGFFHVHARRKQALVRNCSLRSNVQTWQMLAVRPHHIPLQTGCLRAQ